jgi:acyl carrier protein
MDKNKKNMKTFDSIVASLFNLKEEEINDSLSSKDIADWDSMNYLFFIAELEKNFDVSFTMDEVMNAQTLGDLRKIVDKRK